VIPLGEHFIDHPHQAKRLALLTERAELIARTEAFDARWWRVGKCCRYASSSLAVAAMLLFAGTLWAGWSWWFAWATLIGSQLIGAGDSLAAKVTIKRKLAAVHEMAKLDDRIHAAITEALRETEH
jgi:hypothetical protein